MKMNWKKIVIFALGVLTAIVLFFGINLYLALEGSPFEKWQERREVVRIYEEAYGQEFVVEESNFDFKRNEFEFTLYPKDDPDITFRTSLNTMRYKDAYGEVRSRSYIHEMVSEALGSDFDYLGYTMNVFEDRNSSYVFEPDLQRRLAMNSYTVDFSWDVEKIDSNEIDPVFEDIVSRIDDAIDFDVEELKVRSSVYDGEDYYFKDTVIVE
ncbi:hypothetical protein [Gudongella sp. SC589]|jgi:hypothetical protein|uniref:hypothetical protein n=1 Tax=Gudongella sp. SC589 TaxID=3385990 RepID=UPI003904B718